jgi:DNA (cytosine-5)-methyltransferase 1
MRAAVLFAGIGGWEIACHHNGVDVAWACEWDDWKRARYLERWPDAILYHDVASLDGARLTARRGAIDLLLASPPCTDISSANTRGAGIDGASSRYYLDAIRLARETGARWIGFENSPRLRTRGADRLLALKRRFAESEHPCCSAV